MSRILVTGAHGLLGSAVVREFARDADVRAYGRGSLDITDERALAAALARDRPDAVINCAAFNDVDRAEDEARLALAVNAFGVRALSRLARDAGAALVHYGTDFVFDGTAARPYEEGDAPRPRGTYAGAKLLGDWFALAHPHGYVLRVESLFGAPGPHGGRVGSLGTIVSRIRAGEPVPVFVDRTVSPSYTIDVARATREVLARRPAPGLYHCVNTGAASWADIAREAARLLGLDPIVRPITLETAALRAPRPKYCALSNAKLDAAGIEMPSWQDALRRFVAATPDRP